MSTLPTRTPEPSPHPTHSTPSGIAVLGKSVIVKGQIFSREDLTIDGEVEGSVELQEHRLTVGPNGKVVANVKAREVIVMGTVHGNVETTDKLEIRKDAKLVGDIKTARIVIEDGAYFKGNVDIIRAEVSRPAAAPAPAPAPRPQVVPVAPAASASVPMAAGAGETKR
jgi:cytoskeletal protein CcmA (bactofilin family)